MDKLQQAIQEELANRLKSGKIKSSKDLSDLFTETYGWVSRRCSKRKWMNTWVTKNMHRKVCNTPSGK